MEHLKKLPLKLWLIGLLLLVATLALGVYSYQQHQLEKALKQPDSIIIDPDTLPILVYAKALHFAQTGNAGEAARLYGSLRNAADLDLRARALHNLGNLYLRDGAKHWNENGVLEYAHVLTQIQLAKENLREALRLNPQDWAARWNLEYAYRITPPPKEQGKADFQGRKASIYSTLPGLPEGGP